MALADLVSGGVGSPLLALESAPITSQIQFPRISKLDEKSIKVYDGDGKYFSQSMLPEDEVILGFRYHVTVTIPRLDADKIREIQALLNAKEPLRFTPHEDNPTVYYVVYLRSKYTPRWVSSYIPDTLAVTLTFEGLEIFHSLPYDEIAPGGDSPLIWTPPDAMDGTQDLHCKFFDLGSAATWTPHISTKLEESFIPIYVKKQLLSGEQRIYLKGWRYQAKLTYSHIDRVLYKKLTEICNLKNEVGFTPRLRDWSDAHYTVRWKKEFKILYKRPYMVGYRGTILLESVDLIEDIDFYPSLAPLFWMRFRSGTVDGYDAGRLGKSLTKDGSDPGFHNLADGYTGFNNADQCNGYISYNRFLWVIDDCTDLIDSDSGIIMFVKFKTANNLRGYNFHVKDHPYSGQNAGYGMADEINSFGNIKAWMKLSSGIRSRTAAPPGGFQASTWYIGELLYDKVGNLFWCKVYDGAGNLLDSNNVSATGDIIPHATNNTGRIQTGGASTLDGRVQHWLIDNDISKEAEFLALMVGD